MTYSIWNHIYMIRISWTELSVLTISTTWSYWKRSTTHVVFFLLYCNSHDTVFFSFPGPANVADVEKGCKLTANTNLGEILPMYRQDSHLAVQGGSHEFPGEGTYLLKFDNSYSLWRNKTLYYRVFYGNWKRRMIYKWICTENVCY